jgi:hypothetical protein
MLVTLALAVQSVMTVPTPVICAPDQVSAPASPKAGSLSLVIATSGVQDDPRPASCGPDGTGGDFHYRSTFAGARTIAGAPLGQAFEARLKLHSPYLSKYRVALIVERQADGTLLVRRQAGFNGRTGIACFDAIDEWPAEWQPQAPEIRQQGKSLCVFDAAEIDPNAPKD